MSQEGFALKCGLDRTYISGVERGERNVSLKNIGLIAKSLGVSLADLFEGGGAETILNGWQISASDLTEIVQDNPSLRGMLFGYVAEFKLMSFFEADKRITSLRKDDDHDRRKKGDLVVTYKGREFKIESKSLQTTLIKRHPDGRYSGVVQCDASDRREVVLPNGEKVTTTCLVVGEFDILAACLFDFRRKWEFAFALNSDLPRSAYKKYPESVRQYLLKSLVRISWPTTPPFTDDPFLLFERIVQEK